MEKFIEDITNIYDLIKGNNNTKSIINIPVLSKQYLAYYLYRIFTKYYQYFKNALSNKEIIQILGYLHIPKQHSNYKPYPLAGKMTNNEDILDLIILKFIDMFNNLDKYIKSMPNDIAYKNIYNFLKMKNIDTIVQDLIDLPKLIPGLSVSVIRPNYIDDENINGK
jgi:hypothetical protein